MTTGFLNVVSMDPVKRAEEMTRDWKTLPVYVLAARCEAIRVIQANGARLTRETYNAWLCMSAVVTVARACGRGP